MPCGCAFTRSQRDAHKPVAVHAVFKTLVSVSSQTEKAMCRHAGACSAGVDLQLELSAEAAGSNRLTATAGKAPRKQSQRGCVACTLQRQLTAAIRSCLVAVKPCSWYGWHRRGLWQTLTCTQRRLAVCSGVKVCVTCCSCLAGIHLRWTLWLATLAAHSVLGIAAQHTAHSTPRRNE